MKNESLTRKLLPIGISITAVILLTLSSLTNVVGYQSVKSTVNDSPLFVTRTQRAINQQQNFMTSQYLGMNRETLLKFSIRDNGNQQLKKAIDIICNMDDSTFTQFIEICIRKAKQDDTLRDVDHYEIVQALLLLKTNPEAIINSYTIRNNQDSLRTSYTQCGTRSMCVWGPGCLLILLFWIPIILLDVIGEVIYTIVTMIIATAYF